MGKCCGACAVCNLSQGKWRMLDVRMADEGDEISFIFSPRRILPFIIAQIALGGSMVGLASVHGKSCPLAGNYMAGSGTCWLGAALFSIISFMLAPDPRGCWV